MNYKALIIGTLAIILFSYYYSIREKRYHGITRFFSFESIFIMVLLNYRFWFRDPFSLHQILSWIFLFSSIYPGIAGYLLLMNRGKPDGSIERTTQIVNTGIYRYIRHPLYCSLLMLGTGVMFKDPGPFQIVLGIINVLAIYFTARIEEKEMIMKFGQSYKDYMHKTKMFIPLIM